MTEVTIYRWVIAVFIGLTLWEESQRHYKSLVISALKTKIEDAMAIAEFYKSKHGTIDRDEFNKFISNHKASPPTPTPPINPDR